MSKRMLTVCLVNLALCKPSLAADPFTQGCTSYASADYASAKTQFLAAAKAQPKSWQVQYQLGNTFLQLKDLVNAKQAYQKCLSLKPDKEAQTRCESAIAYITNPPAPVPVKPAPIQVQVFSGSMLNGASRAASASTPSPSTIGTPISGSTGSAAPSSADDSRQQAIEAHRKHIISEAEERAAEVREEGKRAVVEADATSNYWWIDRENGGVKTGAREEDKAAIMREYEKKANNILKEAKKRASEITTP